MKGVVALAAVALAAWTGPAFADDPTATLTEVTAQTSTDPNEVTDLLSSATSGSSNVEIRVKQSCGDRTGPTCITPHTCVAPPNAYRFEVSRKVGNGPWESAGEVCLTYAQVDAINTTVTPGMVLTRFKNLEWAKPALIVQPPGGRTLVNLATNFATDLTSPQTRPVTILGQHVLIEATPSSYDWHFGDGATDHTTTPGALYPDLEVTHRYAEENETVTPSVSTTYTGRYRLNGGPWQQIPGTLTVDGPTQTLRVIPATPTLVAPD